MNKKEKIELLANELRNRNHTVVADDIYHNVDHIRIYLGQFLNYDYGEELVSIEVAANLAEKWLSERKLHIKEEIEKEKVKNDYVNWLSTLGEKTGPYTVTLTHGRVTVTNTGFHFDISLKEKDKVEKLVGFLRSL
jgi:hypothetical protein